MTVARDRRPVKIIFADAPQISGYSPEQLGRKTFGKNVL
jgi:hypothetical protein